MLTLNQPCTPSTSDPRFKVINNDGSNETDTDGSGVSTEELDLEVRPN